MMAAIVAPTCGIRSSSPVITASTIGNGSQKISTETQTTMAAMSGLASLPNGGLDRGPDDGARARVGLRLGDPEHAVGDRRALNQQEQRQERQRDDREHRAEDATGGAEQRARRLRQPGGDVFERVADVVVGAG